MPLLHGDPDAFLDLQEALQTIYDLYGYDQAANHRGPPPLPLSAEQAAWAQERLKLANG